jgi:transposase
MMGQKEKHFKQHPTLCLEDLVPQDNFYREVEAKLDLNFVRELVKDKYCWWNGRPSIDPVVFFKLQLIMFFEGIRSERQLMTMTAMRLDHLLYIGYDFDEPVPDHSSLTNIRDRYGLVIAQRFFEQIVELCCAAGLVWGQELYFDGTVSEANADYDKRVPRFYWEAQNHLRALFEDAATSPAKKEDPGEAQSGTEVAAADRHFVHKYNGQQRVSPANSYQREVDYWVNPTDPDASPMGKFKLGYHTHYGIDGGKARIILACLVTPTTIQDNAPMVDLTWWARFRWHLPLDIAVGDTKYGTIANIVALEDGGVKAFTPLTAKGNNRNPELFGRSRFHYQADHDCYICPHGETLHYKRTNKDVRFYRTKANLCTPCPLRAQCTTSKRGRAVTHSAYKSYLDRVARYHQTEAYKKAMRKRQVWVEPLFGESKQWHQGRRFRLRGIAKVNIEALLRAAGQNIKRLLKHQNNPTRPPAQENRAALMVPKPLLDICHSLLCLKWAILGRPSPC